MLALCALVGCFAPGTDVDELEPGIEPPGGLFGGDAGTGSGSGSGSGSGVCGGSDPSPLASLHVRVRTTTLNGRYSPRNVGAIWIETASGAFVKTVERWGGTRARYLTRFNTSSAGNLVDAVTSATLSNHTTHDRVWNLTNLMKCEVPSGAYRVVVELTDRNSAGATLELPFTKAQAPVTLMPTETANFHDLLLELR
jgi:hypothetical protein